jgi:hypothetical protein
VLIQQAQETKSSQRSGGDGRVHVTRPRIPPRPPTVEGRCARASLVEAAPTKFVEPGPWALPLSPHDAAQFPTKPLVQVLEARLDFR